MAVFTTQPELPKTRTSLRNPGVSDGTTSLEFTYGPNSKSIGIRYVENASFSSTLAGQERKQSDSMIRRVDIRWREFSDFIPVEMFKLMRGQGNRARNNLTYIHHRKILSQLPGIEVEFAPGIGQLQGHIRLFVPTWVGKENGNDVYDCHLIFQEANEVQP